MPPAARVGELRFLYVGTDDTEAAVAQWVEHLGAQLRWRFQAFGADVAGVALGDGPLVLLADHRPAGTVLPIWGVDSLDEALTSLAATAGHVTGPLGTPEGDAVVVELDGVELALLEVTRPGAMDDAYTDPANTRRVT
jgi:hypothetical protein